MKMWHNICFWYFVRRVILQIVKYGRLIDTPDFRWYTILNKDLLFVFVELFTYIYCRHV